MTRISWQPFGFRLGDQLELEFARRVWTRSWLVSAFVRVSGIARLEPAITAFRGNGGTVRAVVGVDQKGTSTEGLRVLLATVDEAWVFHNPGPSTFHPKVYAFDSARTSIAFVGSNNLTAGGLYVNTEASVLLRYDKRNRVDAADARALIRTLTELADPLLSPVRPLDGDLIEALRAAGLIRDEAAFPPRVTHGSGVDAAAALFPHRPVPPPPPLPTHVRQPAAARAGAATAIPRAFVMVMGGRDTRQAAGYSRDVYIPIRGRDAAPAFWRWPGAFTRGTATTGTFDERRPAVLLHPIAGPRITEERRLYFYHERDEFRFNAGGLIEGAAPGDLIVFERSTVPGREYEVTVVPAGAALYGQWRPLAVNPVPNSPKFWGYAI